MTKYAKTKAQISWFNHTQKLKNPTLIEICTNRTNPMQHKPNYAYSKKKARANGYNKKIPQKC